VSSITAARRDRVVLVRGQSCGVGQPKAVGLFVVCNDLPYFVGFTYMSQPVVQAVVGGKVRWLSAEHVRWSRQKPLSVTRQTLRSSTQKNFPWTSRCNSPRIAVYIRWLLLDLLSCFPRDRTVRISERLGILLSGLLFVSVLFFSTPAFKHRPSQTHIPSLSHTRINHEALPPALEPYRRHSSTFLARQVLPTCFKEIGVHTATAHPHPVLLNPC
jgi:hypothetical protein